MTRTDTTPLAGDAATGCAALEAVNSSWILAVGGSVRRVADRASQAGAA